MPRRETPLQRARENALAKFRYDNGYKDYHHNRYAKNTDKYQEYYETKVKPKLDNPEEKERRNKLQQQRRAKAKAERLALRKSMPFPEYRKLLADKNKLKLEKKKRIALLKEDSLRAKKHLSILEHTQIDSILEHTQIDRVIQKIKLNRFIRKKRITRELILSIING